MKALAKNPLNRYQSAGEMRADLQRALADRPVEAEAVLTDAERTQFISKGRRARCRRAQSCRCPRTATTRMTVTASSRAWLWVAVVAALLLVIGGGAWAIWALQRFGVTQEAGGAEHHRHESGAGERRDRVTKVHAADRDAADARRSAA